MWRNRSIFWKVKISKKILLARLSLMMVIGLIAFPSLAQAQSYDLLLKGGHVIDPKNNIDAVRDVAVKDGKVAQVASNIPKGNAQKTIDVTGLYVTPGVIDIHTHDFWGSTPHHYLNGSFPAIQPDGFTFRAGVTTVVDAGSSGWKDFVTFKERVIDRAQTRVLAFINIVGNGMEGGPVEQNLNDMDPRPTALRAKQYSDLIVGIKLAHFNGHDWVPAKRAAEAGRLADIPVMIDFGGAKPPLSIEKLFMDVLRPGDIFTHCYANLDSRQSVVDDNYDLRPFVLDAQQRGIVFDVGHGGGSFNWHTAINAYNQGLKPNTISSDLHTGSMNSGMKDMANLMSKFLNMGESIQEVVRQSTWNPAKVIQHKELGHLSEGAVADIAVFKLRKGDFGFVDATPGAVMKGSKKIQAELTLRAGDVVWDRNGISAPNWKDVE